MTTRVQTEPAERTRETVRPSETKSGGKFAKLLADKARERQQQEWDGAKNFLAGSGAAAPEQVSGGAEAAAGAAAMPRDLDQLAQEIVSYWAAQTTDKGRSLDIQFNANTLAGLRVRVRNESGTVSIQLQTDAIEIGRFLSRNLSRLRVGLERRGVLVGQIAVSGFGC